MNYSETPSSSAVAVNVTSNPSGNVFCNGSEVIFTCETRGSPSIIWQGDSFYVGGQIAFVAGSHPINFTSPSLANDDTVATVTQNYTDGDVLVFASTLRIKPLLQARNGFVICLHNDGTEQRIDFQVLGEYINFIRLILS